MDGELFLGIFVIDGPGRTYLFAHTAFALVQKQALGIINGVFQRNSLGIGHINGLSLPEAFVVFIINPFRTFLCAESAGNTFVRVHVPWMLGDIDFEISLFP